MDASTAVLQQISAQLSSFSVSLPFINSTHVHRPLDDIRAPFTAPLSAVWLNALWFSSLICSLASASIALIVKQWLHELTTGLSGTTRESARRRQYRHNNLIKWRVDAIVRAPSILLQIAVVLFLSGLIILLWTLHVTVAIVGTILVSALFLFMVIVTILPAFQWDCCYRSPQALLIYVVIRFMRNALRSLAKKMYTLSRSWISRHSDRPTWERVVLVPIRWLRRDMPTWRGREEADIFQAAGALDRSTATMAYTTTFDAEHLQAFHVILPDLPEDQLSQCFRDIFLAWEEQWGGYSLTNLPQEGRRHKQKLGRQLLHALRCFLLTDPDRRPDCRSILDRMWRSLQDITYFPDADDLVITTLSLLSIGDTVLARRAYIELDVQLERKTSDTHLSYRAMRYGMW